MSPLPYLSSDLFSGTAPRFCGCIPEVRARLPDAGMEQKPCTTCREVKLRSLDHFRSSAGNADGLSGRCRRCDSEKAKAWYAANRERGRANAKAWRERNPERAREIGRANERGQSARSGYRLEVVGEKERMADRLRARLSKVLGDGITVGRCRTWIGCTPDELRAHIERQFRPGMSWENHGEWHIDHIRPFAAFDLTDPDQVRIVSHYTNLQPLWAAENMAKGARLDWAA